MSFSINIWPHTTNIWLFRKYLAGRYSVKFSVESRSELNWFFKAGWTGCHPAKVGIGKHRNPDTTLEVRGISMDGGTALQTDKWVLPLDMVENSISPCKRIFGRFSSRMAVQIGLFIPYAHPLLPAFHLHQADYCHFVSVFSLHSLSHGEEAWHRRQGMA